MATQPTILESVLAPNRGDLDPALAQFILDLDFPKAAHKRYQSLARKAQKGKLTDSEQEALDQFLHVDSFLAVLQLKARRSLQRHGSAA